jgi:hypothetical protein
VDAGFGESGRAVGAEEAEKSTRETCTVRFKRIRWDSVDPVDDTLCMRLRIFSIGIRICAGTLTESRLLALSHLSG